MNRIYIVLLLFIISSCSEEKQERSMGPINWENKKINLNNVDSLASGTTYLSVYSQIYSLTEHKTHDLTVTVSMRNIDQKDSIFITKADYFDTNGKLLRTYFDHPIYIAPMETVEIVIDEKDQEGGTGANFLFQWKIKKSTNNPFFEGIMISTSGQQGLSFTTRGINVE